MNINQKESRGRPRTSPYANATLNTQKEEYRRTTRALVDRLSQIFGLDVHLLPRLHVLDAHHPLFPLLLPDQHHPFGAAPLRVLERPLGFFGVLDVAVRVYNEFERRVRNYFFSFTAFTYLKS